MPTIENHAEHPFHFPKATKSTGTGNLDVTGSAYEEAVTFPRAGNLNDDGNPVPSKTKVSDATLEAIKKHPVARGWFHRTGLAVAATESEDLDPGNDSALGAPIKAKQRQ
jgi:hypothetical protein